MSGDRPDILLQAVTEVARRAGRVALSHFRTALDVEVKRDGSPVTIADRAAETVARDWISTRFPDDAILGEELGAVGGHRKRRWLIDPIDGTKSFVRGVPLWGTLIAVAEGEDVLAGAVYCAAVDEMVAAAVGEGCWWNGARSHVSSVAEVGEATVLVTDSQFPHRPGRRRRWTELATSAALVRTWGDCYGYLLVATGRAEVMADNLMSPWDAAALVPVVQEAGGVFTDWTGRATPFGDGAIATNGALAVTVRARLVVPDDAERAQPGGAALA